MPLIAETTLSSSQPATAVRSWYQHASPVRPQQATSLTTTTEPNLSTLPQDVITELSLIIIARAGGFKQVYSPQINTLALVNKQLRSSSEDVRCQYVFGKELRLQRQCFSAILSFPESWARFISNVFIDLYTKDSFAIFQVLSRKSGLSPSAVTLYYDSDPNHGDTSIIPQLPSSVKSLKVEGEWLSKRAFNIVLRIKCLEELEMYIMEDHLKGCNKSDIQRVSLRVGCSQETGALGFHTFRILSNVTNAFPKATSLSLDIYTSVKHEHGDIPKLDTMAFPPQAESVTLNLNASTGDIVKAIARYNLKKSTATRILKNHPKLKSLVVRFRYTQIGNRRSIEKVAEVIWTFKDIEAGICEVKVTGATESKTFIIDT